MKLTNLPHFINYSYLTFSDDRNLFDVHFNFENINSNFETENLKCITLFNNYLFVCFANIKSDKLVYNEQYYKNKFSTKGEIKLNIADRSGNIIDTKVFKNIELIETSTLCYAYDCTHTEHTYILFKFNNVV